MAGKKKTSAKGSKRGARKRRGKGEDMTGAKEGQVEVRTVGIGDNSTMALPEPDDWAHHKKTIRGWKEKVETAKAGLSHAKKAAIKAGVNMTSLELVTSIERQNDPAKTLNFFEQVDLGLRLSEDTGIRITPHNTLAGDQMDLVYKRGFADGGAGRTADNSYPENSDLSEQYMRGWRHGTGKNMGLTPEQVDASENQREAA